MSVIAPYLTLPIMSDPYAGVETIVIFEPLLKTQCILGEGK